MENKRSFNCLRLLIHAAFMLPLLLSCELIDTAGKPGEIHLRFSDVSYLATKASSDVPDTNSFLLSVVDSKGNAVYSGKYGAAPESLLVSAGSYTITVMSSEFSAPKFSAPQYGDKQVVVVSSGKAVDVELLCRQMNSGIRLIVGPDFLTSYPNGSLYLKSAEGKLTYTYKEKRIAYFKPGNVSLVLSDGGTDKVIFSRIMESQEILTLNVSAPGGSQSKGSMSVIVDTTRNWVSDSFTIGGGASGGSEKGKALSVSQARAGAGSEDVWVYGYIVGGDLTSSGAAFSGPFKSRTAILLGPRSTTASKDACLSVQLLKGDIRDALNLVDNPDVLGMQVFLKGDIVESYYGIPGIQNITEYEFK